MTRVRSARARRSEIDADLSSERSAARRRFCLGSGAEVRDVASEGGLGVGDGVGLGGGGGGGAGSGFGGGGGAGCGVVVDVVSAGSVVVAC